VPSIKARMPLAVSQAFLTEPHISKERIRSSGLSQMKLLPLSRRPSNSSVSHCVSPFVIAASPSLPTRVNCSLINDIHRGAFTYAPPTEPQLSRALVIESTDLPNSFNSFIRPPII
jgi:hypothetical protein